MQIPRPGLKDSDSLGWGPAIKTPNYYQAAPVILDEWLLGCLNDFVKTKCGFFKSYHPFRDLTNKNKMEYFFATFCLLFLLLFCYTPNLVHLWPVYWKVT